MIHVEMQGKFEPVRVDLPRESFLHELNLAAAQGKEFILVENERGGMVGISVHNVLTFEEQDSADLLG